MCLEQPKKTVDIKNVQHCIRGYESKETSSLNFKRVKFRLTVKSLEKLIDQFFSTWIMRQKFGEYLDAQDFDDMWNFSERLTLQISKCGFLIRQFLQLERPWSLDNTKLDPFAERVPASLVQDETMSSTSGHLDMGIGEDNQYFRIFVHVGIDKKMDFFLAKFGC
ncbi:hypothetical protein RCL_jg27970.t1 [Rhizophagus clarus]|uniref:Uncharacterized protein n=1 Tax=Rhizophagus clarus TaxID=94130 RepID=A0A8H3LVJ2_9GLOM|nr:hypothetical protein RCL_jg27970.t1 [Rhizophagus clarus]